MGVCLCWGVVGGLLLRYRDQRILSVPHQDVSLPITRHLVGNVERRCLMTVGEQFKTRDWGVIKIWEEVSGEEWDRLREGERDILYREGKGVVLVRFVGEGSEDG